MAELEDRFERIKARAVIELSKEGYEMENTEVKINVPFSGSFRMALTRDQQSRTFFYDADGNYLFNCKRFHIVGYTWKVVVIRCIGVTERKMDLIYVGPKNSMYERVQKFLKEGA